MALTYEPIATQTLGSVAQTISFASIPNTYTDLVCVVTGGMNTTTGYAVALRINGATANYTSARAYTTGSGRGADVQNNTSMMYALMPATNNLDSVAIINIFNYTNNNIYRPISIQQAGLGYLSGTGVVSSCVGHYTSGATVTSIQISPEFIASWLAGTTATLYGILRA